MTQSASTRFGRPSPVDQRFLATHAALPRTTETMPNPQILSQIGSLHGLLRDLVGEEPDDTIPVPGLGTLGWHLGRCVFRELYWLREVVDGDSDLTNRVRHIFADAPDLCTACAQLPPTPHLLRWAQEVQDEHLRRLATPGALPSHPLLIDDRLPWYLLQEAAKAFESMLSVRVARRLATVDIEGYVARSPLTAEAPVQPDGLVTVTQGHYRIGSRHEPFAYDNELPPQGVELANYRIARLPVSNAQYLGFMQAGGYGETSLWDQDGRDWLDANPAESPVHWRRDPLGHWYGVGVAGPGELPPDQPVSGVNRHEAQAYANWVSAQAGAHGALGSGALPQHEYQWEVAARAGDIQGLGRVWEWCSNPLHPYPDFTPFPDPDGAAVFQQGYTTLRGASLHTQRCLRRASLRHWAKPAERRGFAGIRLVFPPE